MVTKTANKRITGKHPVRNAFSECSTGNKGGAYYETKRDAVHAFESVLNAHGFYVDWENFTNFANDDGRAMLEFHSEGMEFEGHALLTWFRMESGRYEFIGYIT